MQHILESCLQNSLSLEATGTNRQSFKADLYLWLHDPKSIGFLHSTKQLLVKFGSDWTKLVVWSVPTMSVLKLTFTFDPVIQNQRCSSSHQRMNGHVAIPAPNACLWNTYVPAMKSKYMGSDQEERLVVNNHITSAFFCYLTNVDVFSLKASAHSFKRLLHGF